VLVIEESNLVVIGSRVLRYSIEDLLRAYLLHNVSLYSHVLTHSPQARALRVLSCITDGSILHRVTMAMLLSDVLLHDLRSGDVTCL
jgi:hypothetical protein